MKNKLIYLIGVVFFLSLLPVIHTYNQSGNLFTEVTPSFVDDDLYYLARIQDVVQGYPFIGNPYYFEHRNNISPSFFIADWISSIPLILGLDLSHSLALNFSLWSLIFAVLVYLILKVNGLPSLGSVLGSIGVYMSLYIMLLRPVSMQVVAPFFLVFYLSYAIWMKEKVPSKLQSIFLSLAIIMTFYVYTYLWQIVVVILGLTLLLLVKNRDWLKLKLFILLNFVSLILVLPVVFYTIKQISAPYYWETMGRIGLVNTHLPTMLSFYDGGIILAVLALWSFSYFCFTNLKKDKSFVDNLTLVTVSGLGLFLTLFSNVITGKELEISNHIERFIVIWIGLSLFTYFWYFAKSFSEFSALRLYKKLVIIILLCLHSILFVYYLVDQFKIRQIFDSDVLTMQEYKEPLVWLSKNAPKESVVWANGGIGDYVPIETTNFILFSAGGGLHVMPNKEQEERYLISRFFDNLTLEDIKKDFRAYSGVGNSIHQYKTHNRKVNLCNIFKFSYLGMNCGQLTDAVSFKGEDYFVNLFNQYKNDIKPDIVEKLKKFNVTYIVKDKTATNIFKPEKIPNTELVWSEGDFEIYRINYK